jgi:hypothetical protein
MSNLDRVSRRPVLAAIGAVALDSLLNPASVRAQALRAQFEPLGPIVYMAARNLLMPDDSGLAIGARRPAYREGTDTNHKKLRRFCAEQYVGLWHDLAVQTGPNERRASTHPREETLWPACPLRRRRHAWLKDWHGRQSDGVTGKRYIRKEWDRASIPT